jgi:hypothetical protein
MSSGWMRIAAKVLWLPTLVFVLDEIAVITTDSYDRWPWLDIPMHTIGGLVMGYSFFVLLREWRMRGMLGAMHPAVQVALITGLVGCITVFWELHEFLRDILFGEHTQLGLPDTMLDQFLGVLGGWVSATALIYRPLAARRQKPR